MRTLRDFWMEFDGVVDFFDRNGESIDDMDFPLETKVLEEKETSSGYWQVVLDVVAEPDFKENKNKNVEDMKEWRNLL